MEILKDIFKTTYLGKKIGKNLQSKGMENDVFKLPVKEVEDLILGSDGNYKAVAKVSPINGELLSDDDLENVSDAIQGALASFEGRFQFVIQSEKVNIESNLVNIDKYMQTLNQELKIEILEENKKYLASMVNKSRNVLSFYVVIEAKAKNHGQAEQILDDAMNSIRSELESEEMFVDRLNKRDIRSLLYERMNPEASISEPYQDHWELEQIYPSNAKRYKDGRHLEIENRLYRFYSISNFPESVDKYRWLKKIFTVKGDINISITLTPKNKSTISKELSNAVKEVGRKARESEGDEALKQEYEAEVQSAKNMIKDLGSENVNLYDTNITIGISEKDMDSLNTLSETLRSRISSSFCQSTEIKYKDFDPFFTTLPLLVENKITKNYVWNLSSKDIASIIPFDSSELMESDGTLIGENETSRGLVIVNTYNKIYNNPHVCIIADSGSGKTFWIKTDAIRNLPYNDFLIMFDVDGNLNFPWATKYKFAPTSGVITNPFHIRNAIIDSDDESEDGSVDVGNFLASKIMDTIVFFKWILRDMTPFDEALLEEDIRDTYADPEDCGLTFDSKELPNKFCTLSTLEKIMKRKINDKELSSKSSESRENMLASLNPYINGSYSKMFNGQTNWDYKLHTIFDISKLPEAVQKPMYDILLKDTWQFVKKDGSVNPTRKRIYVDECHEFADPNNPQTLKFLSTKLIKQGRKYGLACVTATQNLPDLLSIPRYGEAILSNSYFKLFFRLGETDQPVAQKLYNFSKSEMDIIKAKKTKKKGSKGKGIFIAGSQRVVIQGKASKFELEIIDPVQYEELYNTPSRFYKHKKVAETAS